MTGRTEPSPVLTTTTAQCGSRDGNANRRPHSFRARRKRSGCGRFARHTGYKKTLHVELCLAAALCIQRTEKNDNTNDLCRICHLLLWERLSRRVPVAVWARLLGCILRTELAVVQLMTCYSFLDGTELRSCT